MKYFLLTVLLFAGFSGIVVAQSEASIWYTGNGYGVDFSEEPFKIIENAPGDSDHLATISDRNGRLLFYCNATTVWNAHNEIIENGTELDGSSFSKKLIVPRPGSETQFYIFQVSENYGSSLNSKVLYSLVDMAANDGAGKVTIKNELLYTNLHGSITAGGNCEDGYWLVGETGTNVVIDGHSDQIYAFRIDEDTIRKTPVISEPVSMGHSGFYRLSPDGKKLSFYYGGNDVYAVAIADFNLKTGELTNTKNVGTCCGPGEFSADGRYLYVSSEYEELWKYDLGQTEIKGERIASGVSFYQLGLAPDGKIYLLYNDDDEHRRMAVIHHPERPGSECDLETDVTFSYANGSVPLYLPEFPSQLLYQGPDRIDAGPDVEVCSGESTTMGGVADPSISYVWSPTDHLDNPYIANPIFSYTNLTDSIITFTYHLESCYSDMMKMRVLPLPHSEINGSKSVCPGVELVDYWAEKDAPFHYEWAVDGGALAHGQFTDSIKVNWGPTNPDASVVVTPYNKLNCAGPASKFPVRINVELQTETPTGDPLLCSNLAYEIPYQISNTHGSVYTWNSDYGIITDGQGSNRIRVDWPDDGQYHLWVQEESTTIDTVCYGVSDSLLIHVFTDTTKIAIDYASVLHEHLYDYELQWFINDTSRISSEINIYASSDINPEWTFLYAPLKTETQLSIIDTVMNYSPMAFKLTSINGCQEPIESALHRTIFLQATADAITNTMSLSWTPYVGWKDNMHYEVWYKNDLNPDYSMVASFKPGQLSWTNNWGTKAFSHYFRIKAWHTAYPFETWSNEVVLSFDHPLEIPNVFTPNGDGINDEFNFPFLELYRENELAVYDRNGHEVFSKSDYDGSWAGGNLASGVYYYSFTEQRHQKTYKGWVQILR